MTSNMALAHPHATGVAVYLALFHFVVETVAVVVPCCCLFCRLHMRSNTPSTCLAFSGLLVAGSWIVVVADTGFATATRSARIAKVVVSTLVTTGARVAGFAIAPAWRDPHASSKTAVQSTQAWLLYAKKLSCICQYSYQNT